MTQGDPLTLEILVSSEQVSERLRALLDSAGIICQRVPFGIVARGERATWEHVLGGAAESATPGASLPVPESFGAGVEQITVPVAPTFFP